MPKKKTKAEILTDIDDRNLIYPTISPVSDFNYSNTNQKISWICENNHIFETTFKNILKGHGCKTCTMAKMTSNNVVPVDTFLVRLEKRNKKSQNKVYINDINEYVGMTKPMHWRCDKGHVWQTTPKSVIQLNSYCKICSNRINGINQKNTINDICQKLVKRNNSLPDKQVFLDDNTYIDNKTPMSWICTLGHRWKTPPDYIFNGLSGCPICAKSGFSYKAVNWLNAMAHENNIYIQHALNGGEYKIPNSKYRVDGFCKETNTVYEFYGDEFHGNPQTRNLSELSPISKISYGDLYEKTMKREQFIKDGGYKLIVIWENQYDIYINT